MNQNAKAIAIFFLLAVFSSALPLQSQPAEAEKAVNGFFIQLKAQGKDAVAGVSIALPPFDVKSFSIVQVLGPSERTPLRKDKFDFASKQDLKRVLVMQAMDTMDQIEDLRDEIDETNNKTKREKLKVKIEIIKKEAEIAKQRVKDVMKSQAYINDIQKIEKKLFNLSFAGIDPGRKKVIFERYIAVVNATKKDGSKKKLVLLMRRYMVKSSPKQKGKVVIEAIL